MHFMQLQTNQLQPEKILVSKHGLAQVMYNHASNQKALHSNTAFKAGDLITKFTADQITKTATYLTVQVGLNKHITLKPDFLP
jgi:hypothetical protein